MDYKIFNMCTDVNACDCTQGCTDTVRESALKVDSGGEKSLAALGNRTCISSMPVWCSTNQLIYIPTPGGPAPLLTWHLSSRSIWAVVGSCLLCWEQHWCGAAMRLWRSAEKVLIRTVSGREGGRHTESKVTTRDQGHCERPRSP